jgi:AhpD family alkylhydroperoxidase
VPRVAPATRAELGPVNAAIAMIGGRAAGSKRPLNLFATLGRHRGLFRRWLFFAGGLMPGGKLPRRDTELVILRVSDRTGCPYEADHHRPMGRKAGLSDAQMEFRELTARQEAVVAAVDELHADCRIAESTYEALRAAGFSDRDLIELCLLAGHYQMLAGTINSLGIERDQLKH